MASTLKTFVDSKTLKPEAILAASNRLEAWGNDGRWAASQRAAKRRGQGEAKPDPKVNKYEAIAKPASGRPISKQQLTYALDGKPLPKKVRAKIVRAVNAALATKKQQAVDFKVLFEGAEVKKPKKKEEKKKEVAKKK